LVRHVYLLRYFYRSLKRKLSFFDSVESRQSDPARYERINQKALASGPFKAASSEPRNFCGFFVLPLRDHDVCSGLIDLCGSHSISNDHCQASRLIKIFVRLFEAGQLTKDVGDIVLYHCAKDGITG